MKRPHYLAWLLCITIATATSSSFAQALSPDLFWKLRRVSPVGVTDDNNTLVYRVSTPDVVNNSFTSVQYALDIASGALRPLSEAENLLPVGGASPDGKWRIEAREVKVMPVAAVDMYPDLHHSSARVYNALQHRHWDSWEDGLYSHLFLVDAKGGTDVRDLMPDEPFDCPTKPFGGSEDYVWSPDSRYLVYTAKKKSGTAYMVSTNTDLYQYEVQTGLTVNLTADNAGYDTHPAYSSRGTLAWLSMARDGYEADKNDLKILLNGSEVNLTSNWDGTVNSYLWSPDGNSVFFTAPVKGTIQLFRVDVSARAGSKTEIRQITEGVWDVSSLVKHTGTEIIATRTDMNHAAEIYAISLKDGSMRQLTFANDDIYRTIGMSEVEARWIPTTDGKEMLTWVIYPPDFDPNKQYPALLYTQGGPQSALSQFYSFRWNFQLMAAQGYIVVAPNRRGMPGHGVEWNEQISGDWGGQNMRDYLSAIDALANEPFVDKNRLGCVGASYGGYSVFYLAGMHEGRFKSFISHCGIFNLESMYGTTEELFFTNWDLGGPYWDESNTTATRTYAKYSPHRLVNQWNTPILIIQGGRDYRVPEGQAFEAFTAAQLRGIKSRLLHFPDENHWVSKPQNGLMWQREFFKWLAETLN